MPAQLSIRRILNCKSFIQPSLMMAWYAAAMPATTPSSLALKTPSPSAPL